MYATQIYVQMYVNRSYDRKACLRTFFLHCSFVWFDGFLPAVMTQLCIKPVLPLSAPVPVTLPLCTGSGGWRSVPGHPIPADRRGRLSRWVPLPLTDTGHGTGTRPRGQADTGDAGRLLAAH